MQTREPKPFEIFKKPRHPKYNWDRHNAAEHAEAVARAIEAEQRRRAAPKGLNSLKTYRNRSGIRFGSLPRRERPAAEEELKRRVLAYVAAHGHLPSRAKMGSLVGNVTMIFKHIRTGHKIAWMNRWHKQRRLLDDLDREREREGTPAEVPLKAPVRSSHRGLEGI